MSIKQKIKFNETLATKNKKKKEWEEHCKWLDTFRGKTIYPNENNFSVGFTDTRTKKKSRKHFYQEQKDKYNQMTQKK
tara:strand:+ start:1902 stop:2135 length:234 start_codon:yes stop_codon:yes gene_type:complete